MSRAAKVFRGVLMAVGALTLAAILVLLAQIGLGRLESRIANPSLSRGVITAYAVDDGHTWYSDWDLGSVIIRFPHGSGRTSYWVCVTDGHHNDTWEIRQEDYGRYEVGRAVTREQFK